MSLVPINEKHGSDQENLKNYRPVSNLSFMFKILDIIILTHIEGYLATNK